MTDLILELSDLHLPPGVADGLTALPHLDVTGTACGTVLRVPRRTVLARVSRRLPASMVTILRHARDLGCTAVLIGPDVERCAYLPIWPR